MTTHRFEPATYYNAFGGYEPALCIASGDTVITTCIDAHGADAQGRQVAKRPNPLTGPFFVEGAEPGDALAVRLERLYPNRVHGFTRSTLSENVVDPAYVRQLPESRHLAWRLDLPAGLATLDAAGLALNGWTLPLQPMVGCLGVAAAQGQSIGSMTSGQHGGNMDYRGLRDGARVLFPVFAPGALLFIGDGHAVQGDGEIVGTGIETAFEVQFSVELLKGKTIGWPRGEDADYIFTIGNARPLEQALQHATTEMLCWLQEDYALDALSASTLLGQCVQYDLGNIYDPAYTMVCKLRKAVLPG
jgi:amidase